MAQIRTLSLDLETYSSENLTKCGVYRYTEAPDFEVLLFGYSADGAPVQVVDLTAGETLPADVRAALTDPAVTKWAFNAQFERVCLSRYLGYPTGQYLDPSSWHCTMVWAATLGLPLSLEGVGAVLGLEKQKLKEGKDLIRYFCTPAKARDGSLIRHDPVDAPEKWVLFKAYNLRDVETEMSIQQKLSKFPVTESEWRNYTLDQQINDRGIMLDRTLVTQAIRCDERFKRTHMEQARSVTGLDNPNSPVQLKAWLAEKGVEADSLSKAAVAEMLEKADGEVELALSLRQELAKSSVKKYTAMQTVVGSDDRARGLIQFYGANRTGRYSGRLIQVQNLPQNHLPDLDTARALVRSGNTDAVEMLYDSVPLVLSELIRTAFVPKPGCRFYVADFSAIEARVIAWYAGETWRMDLFRSGGDIYCQSASQMFHVPVEKHGVNGHLRQKGKIAELACIAEGQLVLTDVGLVPIEKVTPKMKLWDGESWVSHGGVIYKGRKGVITYEGLTATPDHLVWVEGQSRPIQFGAAAACGAHLIQTGNGEQPIRLGRNNQPGKTMERGHEPLLCADKMRRLRFDPVAGSEQSEKRKIQRMPKLLTAEENSEVAGQAADRCKAAVRKSPLTGLCQLWRSRDQIRFSKCTGCGSVSAQNLRLPAEKHGNRQDRYKWGLCTGKPAFCNAQSKLCQSTAQRAFGVFSGILALFLHSRHSQIVSGAYEERDHPRCGNSGLREAEELEDHLRTARLYDIRNAGKHHRFTVSGHLVHNCGYGGSVGALKAMGALNYGLQEEELKPLVDAWRLSNPHITKFWWDVDRAASTCVRERTAMGTHGIRFYYQSGMMFVVLPSGRRLVYVKPKMGLNRFGNESVTYEGVGEQKKWQRLESYGPKFVENIVQATARDILAEAMLRLNAAGYRIVMHVHDEAVIEAPPDTSLEDICSIMGQTPAWASGLLLRADGYACDYYKKD